MKRLLSLLMLLCCMGIVSAQTDYGISVKGVNVTSANASDVLGDGKVRYDASNKLLRFYGANITHTGNVLYVGAAFDGDLRVFFDGTNTLTSQNSVAIYLCSYGKVYLSSNSGGKVTVNAKGNAISTLRANSPLDIQHVEMDLSSTGGNGIYTPGTLDIYNTKMTIKTTADNSYGIRHAPTAAKTYFMIRAGSNVNITSTGSGSYGIYANQNSDPTFEQATIKVTTSASAAGALYSYNAPYMVFEHFDTGVNIQSYVSYNSTAKGFTNASTTLVKSFTMLPGKYYNFKVNGVEVTSVNAGDILGDKRVTYSESANTLTLNGATINATGNGIHLGKTVTIKAEGKNNITSTTNGIYSSYPFSITGGGTLNVTSTNTGNYSPITLWNNAKLTVSNTTVNLTGGNYGLYGGYLSLNKCVMSVKGGTKAFYNLLGLEMKDTEIISALSGTIGMANPAGSKYIYYDQTKKDIVGDDVDYVLDKVSFSYLRYGVKVGLTDVNVNNYQNVLGDGKVWYDITTNTLVLDNANLKFGNYERIEFSELADYSLRVKGTNTIDDRTASQNSIGVILKVGERPLRIYGDGVENSRLNILSNTVGMYVLNCSTTISDVYCNIRTYKDNGYGIQSKYAILQNAKVDIMTQGKEAHGVYGGITAMGSTLISNSGNTGSYGIKSSWQKIHFENSHVELLGNVSANAMYFSNANQLELVDEHFNEVVTSADDKYELVSGVGLTLFGNNAYRATLDPGDYLGIAVGGTVVTTRNYNNIFGTSGVPARYEPDTNTLVLNQLNTDASKPGILIGSNLGNVKIKLENNNFVNTDNSGILTRSPLEIMGDGSLSITKTGTRNFFCINTADLTISDCAVVYVTAENCPLTARTLTINGGHLELFSQEYVAHNIRDFVMNGSIFSSYSLDGLYFDYDVEGITFTPYQTQSFLYNGATIKGLIIEKRPNIYGDVNHDGVVDKADAEIIVECIANGTFSIDCDFNWDGRVTVEDLVILNNVINQK